MVMSVPDPREQSGLPMWLVLYYHAAPLPLSQKEGSAGRKGSQRSPKDHTVFITFCLSCPTELQQQRLDTLGTAHWYHRPEMGHLLLVLPTCGWGGKQMPEVTSQAGCQRQDGGLVLIVVK